MKTEEMASGLFYLFWVFLGVVFVAACIAFDIAVLYRYCRTAVAVLLQEQGEPDVVVGPEPAFKQYFFRKAWIDYRTIVGRSGESSWDMMEWVAKKSALTDKGCFVVGQVLLIGAAVGTVTGLLFLITIRALHQVIVLGACAVAVCLAYLFRVLEWGSMLWRRIFLACPHAGCYRRIALPIYVCPSCGAQHKQLIPGSYGTFRRRCKCSQLLPTLFLLGRSQLPSRCPHPTCGRPLNADIGPKRNLHFPIVGGPTAGKSCLLSAMMVELSKLSRQGQIRLSFPEKKDERMFAACQDAFSRGVPVGKTAEYSPTAFLATLEDRRGKEVLLYAYDAAGELYQGATALQGHEYYAYIHGVILVIDPYSLAEARQAGGPEFADVEPAIRPSSEPVDAVYGRMVDALRAFSRQNGRIAQPLAVVLTKADSLRMQDPPLSVKEWLEAHGERNLVRTLHRDFKEVRYFACSALGRSPTAGPSSLPFEPVGVLRPLVWLLGQYGLQVDAPDTLSRPDDSAPPLLPNQT
jgi:hypothetical protein